MMSRVSSVSPFVFGTMALLACPASAGTQTFFQGFEVDSDGIVTSSGSSTFGSISRESGSLTPADGSWYARVNNAGGAGPFTRFDGYRSSWPGGFTAEVDVYLDTTWADGYGFDYSVAASNTSGSHRRDFIFHVAADSSTGKLLVGGSNNSNFATIENLESLNHYEVTSSGWYTLQHVFRDESGTLAVDLKLLDDGGNVLFTETREDSSDLIPSIVGGNRYGWFTFVDVGQEGLAIDNVSLTVVPTPTAALAGLMLLGGVAARRGRRTISKL